MTQQSAAGVIEMTIDIDTQSMTVFLNNIQEKENFAGTELLLSKKFIGANQNFLLANRFHSNFFTVFSRVVAYRAQQQMKTSNIQTIKSWCGDNKLSATEKRRRAPVRGMI